MQGVDEALGACRGSRWDRGFGERWGIVEEHKGMSVVAQLVSVRVRGPVDRHPCCCDRRYYCVQALQ